MHNNSRQIAIVGCGVSGLTCGLSLLENGFNVKILARELPPKTTSDVAGAFWYPHGIETGEKVRTWSKISLEKFQALAEIPGSGISMTTLHEFFDRQVPDSHWADFAPDFKAIVSGKTVTPWKFGYKYTSAKIDAPMYMKYLKQQFLGLGGIIQQENVKSLGELTHRYSIVVNCSGVGAKELAHDDRVFPIRGQVLLVRKPTDLPSDIFYVSDPSSYCYIIPHKNHCILGSTKEENNWSLKPDEKATQLIIERCAKLNPVFANPEILESKVGLRPGRYSVRLELEKISQKSAIIHNYGHGSIGHTIAWGCAKEVVKLVREIYG